MHETHLALAPVVARLVQTMTVLTVHGMLGTLVDVCADVAVTPETGVADALEWPLGVPALRVLVAASVIRQTLVDVPAGDAVADEAVLATTAEWPLENTIKPPQISPLHISELMPDLGVPNIYLI